MGRAAPRPPALKLYLVLNAVALLGAAAFMAQLARGGGGYSAPRMLLVAAAALLGIAAAVLALLLQRRPSLENRLTSLLLSSGPRLRLILAAAFVVFWCLVWFPPQYTGDAYYYFIAIYPLVLCALLASGTALIWLTATHGSSTPRWSIYFRQRRHALGVALLVLAGCAFVALLAVQFRILRGFEPYWYGAGVPLLAAQVLIALGVAVVAFRWENWSSHRLLSADTILFALIWIVAAALWASRPVPAGYWATAPRPPNFELYPFSDAATYDIGSQFALIGQGLYNGMFFDRALYMSFLVYLHLVGGQNYQLLMSIQAAIFAVFPAVLYLIGRRLHSRTAGLVLAALIIMRGLTSLDASAWIDTANFKHMLTDFPTAIGVAVFVLLTLEWLAAPRERLSYLMWAGGVLGLTSLLRPHVLLLMAATALLALWVYRPRWGRSMGAAALALMAFLMGVLPWLTLGPSSGSLVVLYGDRVRAVIAQRFPQPTETPAPTAAAAASVVPAAGATAPVPSAPPSPATVPPAVSVIAPPVDPGPPFFVDHFIHNLITSALVFPTSPQLLNIRSVVKDGEAFWRPRWNGGMSAFSAAMLILNLAVVAFGVGIAAQRNRLRGLLPLAVLVLYLAADSVARTSGGRYIVPVDWILIAYFSIAVAEIVQSAAASCAPSGVVSAGASPKSRGRARARAAATARGSGASPVLRAASHPVAALVFVLLLGALVPLAGALLPRRYTLRDVGQTLSDVTRYLPALGSEQDIRRFLQQPNAVLMEGRLLYPVHYRRGEGEPTHHAPYAPQDFPRSVFVHVGPSGLLRVTLPGARTPALPDASDAIVLGCRLSGQSFNLVQAVALVLPAQELGILRSPAQPLACPLPDPVCDANGNCR